MSPSAFLLAGLKSLKEMERVDYPINPRDLTWQYAVGMSSVGSSVLTLLPVILEEKVREIGSSVLPNSIPKSIPYSLYRAAI